ncbi:bZIP transcription factor [Aporhodopirellula aestuarii]|uniref:BZIP transcription factor n=1 Tax=Aporhodopirellula aestuarii TaxID=2950107 RepID=A0ABT0U9P8_9BACT|nr:bZIP transcription factor [Aporhodopirellula aestuarii]MCM2373707.1 bZIP transcription factor [Aporhodopirellula aestuarii]
MTRLIVSLNLLVLAASLSPASADSPHDPRLSAENSGVRVAFASPDDGDDLRLMLMGDDPVIDGNPADDEESADNGDPSSIPSLGSDREDGFDPANERRDRNRVAERESTREKANQLQADEAQRLARRIAILNKSPRELRLAPHPAGENEVPVNQAAIVLDDDPQWIVGGNRMPPRAARVHIRFCHQPTYYQEMNLERCGQVDCDRFGCLQNGYSSFWFLANTAMLPYRVASEPHCRCVTGYGDCPTCQQYDCSIEPLHCGETCCQTSGGLLSESAAIAGFAFLLL